MQAVSHIIMSPREFSRFFESVKKNASVWVENASDRVSDMLLFITEADRVFRISSYAKVAIIATRKYRERECEYEGKELGVDGYWSDVVRCAEYDARITYVIFIDPHREVSLAIIYA